MFECLRNSSYTQWCRQLSENNNIHGSAVVCSVMHSTAQVLGEHFGNQFRDFSSLCYVVSRQDTNRNNRKCMLCPTSLQHNTSYTMFSRTFLEVFLNSTLTFVQSITQTTGKLFLFWMYWMMRSQFSCCIETLWTFIANIWLHSFMSLNVYCELLFAAEFLLTNVTREPSTFIVWLQQMCLELF